ncbi:hypothetical protein N7447_004329 [Penicillium robsamsonii]|uniref:uncharacterized protein n=1 Tax=Penicillium robsamsonii TaxID=1792511 RepID=UPI002547C72D|nr:uncharacterized protein N7447_004329 [Penicillium robsamsonii]KAJ5827566.1 hypothetical protein N7447_004329 [Penicillium robsamsonii]
MGVADSVGRPVCLLFGPQCSNFDAVSAQISRTLAEDSSVQFIYEILQDLPSLWTDITKAFPPLRQVSGGEQIIALVQQLHGSPSPHTAEPTSMILTPLTVISQILEFIKLKESDVEQRIIDTQGFCVGFLSAVAVACSKGGGEFRSLAATIVRLAVCIGALVDLDELVHGNFRSVAVKWKDLAGCKTFQQVIASHPKAYASCELDTNSMTVTVPEEGIEALVKDLTSHNLSAKPIALRGRFHHEAHKEAVQRIFKYFEHDKRFLLPNGSELLLPIRSNVDGNVIRQGGLLAIALESILVMQCKWFPTVADAFHDMRQANNGARLLTVGESSIIPRSVSIQSGQQNGLGQDSNGYPNGLKNGHASTNGVNRAEAMPNFTLNGHRGDPVTPIAIVGMAGRYPQADSVEALWEMLELGRCAVSEMPNDRFKMKKLLRQPNGPFFGNYLDDPEAFDHRFFGISAREAEAMDPQQRLLLQVAYNAMESAGYCGISASSLTSDIGCYIGVGSDDYTDNVGSRDANAFSATGTLQAFNSGRISHYFGWSGPSLIVDTACSSAAVAIHLACKALQAKECSIAMAGGVNVMTSPKVTQNLAAASFLSPTGASRAFDADANGYCRGEGAGLVVLRPLEDALRDHDTVLAVIAGSAVNQGSNCSPITVPVSESQQSLYRKALVAGATSPYEVSYIEAHGTGTQVGDPIEFDSIRQVFGGRSRAEMLWIGSIKDNIGHTETSSGVAGLLKTVLMIQKGRIPKQANFSRLNPKIPSAEKENISIPDKSVSWESTYPAAMVTNYGAAGSNAALLVKQHASPSFTSDYVGACASEVPIFISAKSQESLLAYCEALHSFVNDRSLSPNESLLQDVAYNLAIKQNREMDYIATFSTSSSDTKSFLNELTQVISTNAHSRKKPANPLPVILCFGGQTGNTASISEDLYNSCGHLRFHLMECENACNALGLPSLFPTIFQSSPIKDLVSLHCMLFSIQYASAKAWIDSGLKVDRIIGHSFGQLTGLCVAGGLSLSDAITLISQRARLISSSWGLEYGSMLSIKGTPEDILDLLKTCNNTVDIACYNGPRDLVVAGEEASIANIEAIAVGRSMFIQTKRLRSTHAFHSRLVDSIVPGLTEVAESLVYHEPRIPIEACSELEDWTSVTPTNIVQHSRMPVYFESAVKRAAEKASGQAIWLEAGSGSPVIPMIRQIIQSSESPERHVLQPINLQDPQAERNIAKATSKLWSSGVKVQFWAFSHHQAPSYKSMNLPPYQFAKTKHWIPFDPLAFLPVTSPSVPDTSSGMVKVVERNSKGTVFSVNVSHPVYRLCAQGHSVVGQHLCPASLYIEIILEAASKTTSEGLSGLMPHIHNLSICTPLLLESEGEVCLQLSQTDTQLEWSFSLFTQQGISGRETHATGEIGLYNGSGASQASSRFRSLDRLISPSHSRTIANSTSASGLVGLPVYQTFNRVVEYADYFRGVKNVFSNGHEATGLVSLQDSPSANGICDPVLLDNFLQVAGIHTNCLSETREDEVFVCSAIGDIFLSDAFITRDTKSTRTTTTYTSYDRPSKKQFMSDIFVFDSESGKLLLAIMSATFTSVLMSNLSRALSRLNKDAPTSVPQSIERDPLLETQATSMPNSQESPKAMSDRGGHVEAVREMFHTLLGIPLKELLPSSGLEDIGVDSLMRTEVLAEIKNRFGFNLSVTALLEISDIQSLANTLFPDASFEASDISAPVETIIKTPAKQMSRQVSHINLVPTPSDSLAALSSDVFANLRTTSLYSQKAQWTGFCDDVYPQQMALVTAYVVEAFEDMGIPLDSFGPGQVIPQLPVLPQHQQVKDQLYSILEFSKLVQRQGDGIIRTANLIPTTPSLSLHQQIVRKYPRHELEHNLLHTTGSQLAKCLTGSTDPLALLFQDKKARELIGNVYTHAPMFLSATMHLTQFLRDVLSKAEPGREIKILEIGAGTGGTTGFLLGQLADVSGLRFEYTFTDISSSLIALARKRFQKYNFMCYTTLNIDQDPPEAMLGQYDVIISSNCVHATPSIMRSTKNINSLLRPDGILCLIELTRNLFWFDLVFGLLEGWWLFGDGRQHALASEYAWDKALRQAGYRWVDWSSNTSKESEILRLIVASPADVGSQESTLVTEESVTFAEKNGVELLADIYYPTEVETSSRSRPIALMIHGGGHVMLSRKDIRPKQTKMLLAAGFLPVSIDYRLCPEVSLLKGPMEDCRDALEWARQVLPGLALKRPDVKPDGDHVVSVGWSTGGHLAMTLAWTSAMIGVRPPEAILSFYCPTDYEDPFWSHPNLPFGHSAVSTDAYDWREGIQDKTITSYNPPSSLGGWMNPSDARSRIALHMNWTGQTVPVLLNKQGPNQRNQTPELEPPSVEAIQSISPLAQIRTRKYQSPTFIIHGTRDDLIPIAQAQRTYNALSDAGVDSEIRVLDAVHLFDTYPDMEENQEAVQAVQDGFAFLKSHVKP